MHLMRALRTAAAAAVIAGGALFSTGTTATVLVVGSGWNYDQINDVGVPSMFSDWTFTVTDSAIFSITDAFNFGDQYGQGLRSVASPCPPRTSRACVSRRRATSNGRVARNRAGSASPIAPSDQGVFTTPSAEGELWTRRSYSSGRTRRLRHARSGTGPSRVCIEMNRSCAQCGLGSRGKESVMPSLLPRCSACFLAAAITGGLSANCRRRDDRLPQRSLDRQGRYDCRRLFRGHDPLPVRRSQPAAAARDQHPGHGERV